MSTIGDYVAQLGSAEESERLYAAEDIGLANDRAGVAPLLARLEVEPSRAVGEAIFAALLQIDDEAVITGAVRLLDSENSFVRNQAVELLRALGEKTVPYLERAFADGGADRRKFLLDVAACFADARADSFYRRALLDSDINVVITAVENLGRLRQLHFRAAIEQLLEPGAHPMLLSSCLEALAQAGDSGSVSVVRERLGPVSGVPGYLRGSYLKLLGAQGGPEAVAEIEQLAGQKGLDTPALNALASLRNRFPEIVLGPGLAQPLRELAANAAPQTAYQALRLLGAFHGDQATVAFLFERLADTNKEIRIGAIQALGEAAGDEARAEAGRRLAGEQDPEIVQVWRNSTP